MSCFSAQGHANYLEKLTLTSVLTDLSAPLQPEWPGKGAQVSILTYTTASETQSYPKSCYCLDTNTAQGWGLITACQLPPRQPRRKLPSQIKAYPHTWPIVQFQEFVYPYLSCLNLALVMSLGERHSRPGCLRPGQEEKV